VNLKTRLPGRPARSDLGRLVEATALMQAELLARANDGRDVDDLTSIEFRVFSQFGDDGILQYLTRRLDLPHTFVEVGVEDYTEACTRLLVLKDNWRGMIVDSSVDNMRSVRESDLYWRHDVTAVSAFVSTDNIDSLLAEGGFVGEVGVFVLDIDGNDYWVWERLSAIQPVVAVVEYNSVLGPDRPVAVPYDPDFVRTRAHHSNLYWGSSIAALTHLAKRRGYQLVGSNAAGNNVYFVRADRAEGLPAPTASEAWRESRFRESRDAAGRLTFLAGSARAAAIAEQPLIDVVSGERLSVGDL
jgi:hypothetical protein